MSMGIHISPQLAECVNKWTSMVELVCLYGLKLKGKCLFYSGACAKFNCSLRGIGELNKCWFAESAVK